MHQRNDRAAEQYPLGRGYGNDYMRGGEVLGGYGYSAREEYWQPRGELAREGSSESGDGKPEGESEARR